MKYILFTCFIIASTITFSQKVVVKSPVRFLALGDSYTIGQSVQLEERWPYQLVNALNIRGIATDELAIIAQTGWRTDNLLDALSSENPDLNYNMVSLLIGVNNQFQGRNIDVYKEEFRELLEIAIERCGGRKEGVFVLSIPDYGYTPFGFSDQARISAEIDQYNQINRQISLEMGIAYFYITGISREAISKPEYLASDNLHPSGIMYEKWVETIINSSDFRINTSATAEIQQDLSVTIFPNPARTEITIQTPFETNSVVIYNSQGGIVWQSVERLTQNYNIDISGWNNGIYYYQVIRDNIPFYSGKFLKK